MEKQSKVLDFEQEARTKLVKGVVTLAKAVKSTLGARGATVLIESDAHVGGMTITKDGITVAKEVRLVDPVEDLAVRAIVQAAARTAVEAGDGTTSAIVIAEALILNGFKLITPELSRIEVLRHMQSITEGVIRELKRQSIPVRGRRLGDVAVISTNNDTRVGKVIASAFKAVGKDGSVIVSKAMGATTYADITSGIRMDRGYVSPYLVTDHGADTWVKDNVRVLLSTQTIDQVMSIEKAIKPLIKSGTPLLFIAPLSKNMTNVIVANALKNSIPLCAIEPPSFGYKQDELMNDLALALGGKTFSERTGDMLEQITLEDLGTAARVTVGRSSTTIVIDQSESTKAACKARIEQLLRSKPSKRSDKDFMAERISILNGTVAVVHVGGNTEIEQKELFDRVDDAICAVESALQEGVVCGAGKALAEISIPVEPNAEYMVARAIISEALIAPYNQIISNAGGTPKLLAPGQGYNVRSMEEVDLIKEGIIDPVKVVRCALQNAVSVAVTILSTNAVITNHEKNNVL